MFLVSGATGNVGGELVRALAGAGHPVRALTRPGRAPDLPPGVAVATGDLNEPDSLAGALAGVSGVFLLAGYADMPGLLARVADAGVQQVVLLSSGAVAGGDVANAVVRYNVVSEAAVHDSGLAGTILRPSGFHSNALRWLPQLRAGNVIREAFADVPVASIDPLDIAAVAALALTQPAGQALGQTAGQTAGQTVTYRLTGPAPVLPAVKAQILGKVLGRDLVLEPLSDADARAEMSASTPQRYVDAFFSFFADGTYDDARVDPTAERLLGRPPRTFEQWAQAHADDFAPSPPPA
jgi:uncharacterized protein YbjT (DUF2867 family)